MCECTLIKHKIDRTTRCRTIIVLILQALLPTFDHLSSATRQQHPCALSVAVHMSWRPLLLSMRPILPCPLSHVVATHVSHFARTVWLYVMFAEDLKATFTSFASFGSREVSQIRLEIHCPNSSATMISAACY